MERDAEVYSPSPWRIGAPNGPNAQGEGRFLFRPSALAIAVFLACTHQPAAAAQLLVGPDETYKTPSAAIAKAHDGDAVVIAPGDYFDCAIVRANSLTIVGAGAEGSTVLTDKPCAGKALLVIAGHDVTVRNLTLTRVRVPDGNGAGIRAEGRNLTVEKVLFVNNQDGILAGNPDGTLVVRDSVFRFNSPCDETRCGHSIEAGGLKLLRVSGTVFSQTRGGEPIRSSARRTELLDNRFNDEGGRLTGPMVLVTGDALVRGNTFNVPEHARNRKGLVLALGEDAAMTVRDNAVRAADGHSVPLLCNWTGRSADVGGNTMPAGVAAETEEGSTSYRWHTRFHSWRESLHSAAGSAKRAVLGVVRTLR